MPYFLVTTCSSNSSNEYRVCDDHDYDHICNDEDNDKAVIDKH